MRTRTIRDINSKNDTKRLLSPIRENEGLNDSHEFVVENNIHLSEDDKFLAKSYQNEKDWKKLDEVEKIESNIEHKNFGQKLKSRNKQKINAKTFKMKSHILLPSKLLSARAGEEMKLDLGIDQKEKNKDRNFDSGELSPPFEI